MVHRLAGLVLALAVLAGCAPSRVTFEPTPSRAEVSAAEVAAGDRLYPFPTPLGMWGYMDVTGRVIVEPAFASAEPFEEGRAAVRLGDAYGYIDPSGEVVVPARFTSAAPYAEGRALVSEGPSGRPRYGFIDPSGAEVVPVVLPLAYSYSEGRALVRLQNRDLTWVERLLGLWRGESMGFLDLDGDVVFYLGGEAASFSEGLAPFSEPRFFARDRWGYVSPDGSVAVPATIYGTAFRHTEGLARVVRGDAIGFVDADGEPAFGQVFELAQPFSEGLAAVQIGGLWGYADTTGAFAIAPQFDQAGTFSEGLAAVEKAGRWGYVGPDGTYVIEPVFRSAQSFRGPLASVSDESGPHYIDRSGRPVRPDLPPR